MNYCLWVSNNFLARLAMVNQPRIAAIMGLGELEDQAFSPTNRVFTKNNLNQRFFWVLNRAAFILTV
jgi:hypothetical protein